MNYSFFIARRLSFGSDGRRSSPAVRVATIAIALSVTVMLAAIAIVSGFKREITEKVTGFNSDILVQVQPMHGADNILDLTPNLRRVLDSVPGVKEYALQTTMPAILKTPTDFKGIYLKGIVDEPSRRFFTKNLVQGRVPEFGTDTASHEILISRMAASQLGLNTGDRIDTYFITDEVRVRPLRVAGVYDSHFEAYDNVMVYGDVRLINSIAGFKGQKGLVMQVTVDDFSRLHETTDALCRSLDAASGKSYINRYYAVDDARSNGAGYFHWLDLLDVNVVVILALMTAVGCITLVSGMLIMILDKKRLIGLLKSLGAPTRAVRRVFVYLAIRVAWQGMLVGNVLGLGLLFAQMKTHFIPLDADSYYIDFVPVEISWPAILLLNAGVIVVVWAALVLPSRFVAGISPAETMRSAE